MVERPGQVQVRVESRLEIVCALTTASRLISATDVNMIWLRYAAESVVKGQ